MPECGGVTLGSADHTDPIGYLSQKQNWGPLTRPSATLSPRGERVLNW